MFVEKRFHGDEVVFAVGGYVILVFNFRYPARRVGSAHRRNQGERQVLSVFYIPQLHSGIVFVCAGIYAVPTDGGRSGFDVIFDPRDGNRVQAVLSHYRTGFRIAFAVGGFRSQRFAVVSAAVRLTVDNAELRHEPRLVQAVLVDNIVVLRIVERHHAVHEPVGGGSVALNIHFVALGAPSEAHAEDIAVGELSRGLIESRLAVGGFKGV